MDGVNKPKRKRESPWWPDVTTDAGIKTGIKVGALAAGWLCFNFFKNAAIVYFFENKFSISQVEPLSAEFRIFMYIIWAIIALILCYNILIKYDFISSFVVFAWLCAIVVTTLVRLVKLETDSVDNSMLAVNVLALLASISGMRGTHAKRKLAN